jgi:uncharacterized protein YyaL (SSP411 family)
MYLPSAIVVAKSNADDRAIEWPVFFGRTPINGQPTAYVCRNYTCQLPTNDLDTMMADYLR